jgi:hypothetical protein
MSTIISGTLFLLTTKKKRERHDNNDSVFLDMPFSRKKIDHSVIQYKKDKKDILNEGKRKKK